MLNLRLLELDDPKKRVESHDSEIVLVVGVGGSRHEELDEVGEMRGKERNFGKGEGFDHFEDGFGGSFVGFFESGRENVDNRGDKVLESSLQYKSR